MILGAFKWLLAITVFGITAYAWANHDDLTWLDDVLAEVHYRGWEDGANDMLGNAYYILQTDAVKKGCR